MGEDLHVYSLREKNRHKKWESLRRCFKNWVWSTLNPCMDSLYDPLKYATWRCMVLREDKRCIVEGKTSFLLLLSGMIDIHIQLKIQRLTAENHQLKHEKKCLNFQEKVHVSGMPIANILCIYLLRIRWQSTNRIVNTFIEFTTFFQWNFISTNRILYAFLEFTMETESHTRIVNFWGLDHF